MTIQLPPGSWQHVGLSLQVDTISTIVDFVNSSMSAAPWIACKGAFIQDPPLTTSHRRLHLQWTHEHRARKADWYKVVFSDESRFNL
ncbi:uncharacterized protein TNCV_1439941 [Trichonephila clavipes]|nr:uncharacterized protein TNCV_1439941 [Trichonephila clavipes]